jgi:hypothetical protein
MLVKDYEITVKNIEEFILCFRKMWFTDNKPHGFDAQDIRLGGVIQRLKANRQRLIEYIDGLVPNIPELDEELVDIYDEGNQKKIPFFNNYRCLSSVNIV